MATISFSGIGTGMDINSLVSQLVEAERAPTENRINSRASKINSQLSALGTVKSALSNLQSAFDKLATSSSTPAYKTSVQADAGFTASAGSTATAGSYQVEVVSLAQTHKLSSSAFASDAVVGHGTLSVEAGENSYSVEVAEGATLADIAKAINQAAAGKGVTASVVNADDGQHLVLNATSPGGSGAMKITASGGDGGLGALVYDPDGTSTLEEKVAPADAQVRVDGLLRTADSNTIGDLVPGLTLNLTKAKPGETFSLQVATDNSSLKTNLQSVVAMYNTANTLLRSTSAYNAETETASALTGDAMVRGLQQQLRGMLGDNSYELKQLGISIATDGTLSLDSSKFDSAMASSPDRVNALLGKDGTLGKRMDALLDGVLDSSQGSLTLRTKSLNAQIEDLSDQVDALDLRMERVEARYMAQFTAMDTLVAQMNSTSSYLTQQLSALQSSTNKS